MKSKFFILTIFTEIIIEKMRRKINQIKVESFNLKKEANKKSCANFFLFSFCFFRLIFLMGFNKIILNFFSLIILLCLFKETSRK